MKYCLSFLFLAFLFGSGFGQQPSYFDYESIMRSNKGLVGDFIDAGENLSTAASNYIATIESVFASESQNTKGPSSGNTKYQQRQVERMIHVVPVFISVAKSKEELMQRIDSWVNGFCKEFGLPYEQEKMIRQDLMDYAKSYSKYLTAYNKLQEALNNGRQIPPSIPPPPPPPQQHHGN